MKTHLFPLLLLTASVSVFSSCGRETQDSAGVKDALLQSRVDELQEKLRSLSGTMSEEMKLIKDEQNLLVSDASIKIVDLQAENLTVTIERFTLPESEFIKLIASNDSPPLHEAMKALASKGEAKTGPVLSVVLSPLAASDSAPEFVLSDVNDLDVPTEFDMPAEKQENPTMTPKGWSREEIGTTFTGKILAREADRLLLEVKYNEATRLANQPYPFPKIFADKEPGQLEMPVIHQAGISTTAVIQIGRPEFLGTAAVPAEHTGGTKTLETVFLIIRKL